MNKSKLVLGILCAALTVGGSGLAQAQTGFHPGRPMMQHERHPELRKAIRTLERARTDLFNANWDFHGHKDAAIHHIDAALAELKEAMGSDRH